MTLYFSAVPCLEITVVVCVVGVFATAAATAAVNCDCIFRSCLSPVWLTAYLQKQSTRDCISTIQNSMCT